MKLQIFCLIFCTIFSCGSLQGPASTTSVTPTALPPHDFSNVTFFNVSNCLFFFANKITLAFTDSSNNILSNCSLAPTQAFKDGSCGANTTTSDLVFSYNQSQVLCGIDHVEFRIIFSTTPVGDWVVSSFNVSLQCKPGYTANCTNIENSFNGTEVITAPVGLSYHCNSLDQPLVTSSTQNSTMKLQMSFTKIQVQPFNVTGKFSSPNDCVGLFTIGIWSNLLVAAILIGILSYGLHMIMSIQTNDRFDDPKAKQLQMSFVS